jgi:cell wall assembly regulator SMI1
MNHELPAWQQIESWLQSRVADLQRFALPPASGSAVAALEQTLDRALPGELRAWFALHAGTTKALCFMESEIERVPYWPLMPPSAIAQTWTALRHRHPQWLPEWLPLAKSASGSIGWYLCCALPPVGAESSGPIVLLDDADGDYFEPHQVAASLSEYFAPLARSMAAGDIVAVGFDDEPEAPAELMTRARFAQLRTTRDAYTLPRTAAADVAVCDAAEEGLRFLHLLVARGQLVLSRTDRLARLGKGIGKLLQSPRPSAARAHAVCEWLAEQPDVEEIYATDHEMVDLLEAW